MTIKDVTVVYLDINITFFQFIQFNEHFEHKRYNICIYIKYMKYIYICKYIKLFYV